MKINRSYLIFFILLLLGCSEKTDKKAIDLFLKKYGSYDFSEYKNTCISIKNSYLTQTDYVLSSPDNRPLYIICYNVLLGYKKIEVISSEKNKGTEYPIDTVKKIISNYRYLDFFFLEVDKDNNVFVNPFAKHSPPFLMRLNTPIESNELIKNGYRYIHYKDNWFLNSRHLDSIEKSD